MCVCRLVFFFFVKQKSAYEMRISDWSSDVCSSDLSAPFANQRTGLCRWDPRAREKFGAFIEEKLDRINRRVRRRSLGYGIPPSSFILPLRAFFPTGGGDRKSVV